MKVNKKNGILPFYSRLVLTQGLGTVPSATSQVTPPFAMALPGPALLPPDGKGRGAERDLGVCVTSLGRGGGSRDSGTQRLGDLGTQGQARLPVTPVATQDNGRSQTRAGIGNLALY